MSAAKAKSKYVPRHAWQPNPEGRKAQKAGEDRKWYVRVDNWQPARLNQWDGRHWSVRAKFKKFDRDVIAVHCVGAGVPKAEKRRKVSLIIVLGPRQRGGDPDSYWKSLLDGLVHCGAIRDDSKEHLKLGEVTYERGPRKATVICIEEIKQRDRGFKYRLGKSA